VAALGLSTTPAVLRLAPWVVGQGSLTQCPDGCRVDIYIGVASRIDDLKCDARCSQVEQAIAQRWGVEGSAEDLSREIRWDDVSACTRGDDPEILQLCDDCRNNLLSTSTLVLAILTQLPTMATDLQRTTLFGDVNCQKSMGVVTNLCSLVSSMMSLLAFRAACYQRLPTDIDGQVAVQWSVGLGFKCLVGATLIKIVDALCHVAVPTPSARWEKPDKKLSLVEYLRLGDSAAPDDSESEATDKTASDASSAANGQEMDGDAETGHSIL